MRCGERVVVVYLHGLDGRYLVKSRELDLGLVAEAGHVASYLR
jgi:hypothetical protein